MEHNLFCVPVPYFAESFGKSHSFQQLEWSDRLVKIGQIHDSAASRHLRGIPFSLS